MKTYSLSSVSESNNLPDTPSSVVMAYDTPAIEIINIESERGFTASANATPPEWEPGNDDWFN